MPILTTLGSATKNGYSAGGGAAALYLFTTATFTNGDYRSQNPASSGQLLGNISGTPSPSTWTSTWLSISAGYLTWTVPKSGTYRITTAGAAGLRTDGSLAGQAAIMRGDFNLIGGNTLRMLIGQRGVPAYGSAGGGGTYVATSTNSPLIVSGGGGGSAYDNNITASYDINATTQQTGSGRGGFGGTGGGGSSYSNSGGCGGVGAGGGGFSGSGQQLGGVPNALSFLAGGTGGEIQSGANSRCVPISQGGFGGGGGGGNTGPGGGGYTGGDGHSYDAGGYYAGQGGGSYNGGANQSNSVGHTGSGYIIITALS